MPRVTYRCPECKSTEVLWDAWACWDDENQCFELNADPFDHSICGACDAEITPEEVPIE